MNDLSPCCRTVFMAAVILRELGMDEVQTPSLVKGLRPNSLKIPAHTRYLVNPYDTKS